MLTIYMKANVGDEVLFIKSGNTMATGKVVRKYMNNLWIKQTQGNPTLSRRSGEIFNLTEYKRKCLTLPSVCDIKTTKEILHDS